VTWLLGKLGLQLAGGAGFGKLIAVLAIAAVIVVAGGASIWYVADLGKKSEVGKCASDKVAQLAAANAQITRLEEAARAEEARRVQDMNVIAANYAKGYEDAEERRRRDVAAARDGALKLRVSASVCAGAGGGSAAAPGPARPVGDGAATIELPPAITADLFALVDDADQVADQLRSCQQIVLSDRRK
jgi:hypothetical protein